MANGILIAPSVLSADFARLKDEVQAVEAAGADWLHVDVMDGHFVPNLTMGPCVVEGLKRLSKLPLDCHLMIENPEKFVGAFAKAGASTITVHPEAAGDIHGALKQIRELGVRPSMAIKPATPVSVVEEFKNEIEMLLVMTVNPGFSGQKMIVDCLPKYAEARARFGPQLLLEIDGGVMPENAAQVRAAGAQVIVAATAIFKSSDYGRAVRELRG